ncbi:hypothetical protein MRB53_039045 [Persea americana]|nr:hypothetical protein MRB53_039045 [Persea americana]
MQTARAFEAQKEAEVTDTMQRTSIIADHLAGKHFSNSPENEQLVDEDTNNLKRGLDGRHMQMIAIWSVSRLEDWEGFLLDSTRGLFSAKVSVRAHRQLIRR